MREKRKHERTPIDIPMRWSEEGAGAAAASALCRDVSLGGCFLETEAPARIGTGVTLFLDLPELRDERHPPAGVPCTVRWTTPRGMGVQFGLMGARETAAIVALLRAGAPASVPRRPPVSRRELLHDARFPRSNAYHPKWVADPSLRAHPLWSTEWMLDELALAPGQRVLEISATGARVAIFMARERGVEVWSVDPASSSASRQERIEAAGCTDRVLPMRTDLGRLPFPDGLFDAVICVDASDETPLESLDVAALVRLLRPGGRLGFVSTPRVVPGPAPSLHAALHAASVPSGRITIGVWRAALERTGIVEDVAIQELAHSFEDGEAWAEATGRAAPPPRIFPRGEGWGSFALVARRHVGQATSTDAPPPLLRADETAARAA